MHHTVCTLILQSNIAGSSLRAPAYCGGANAVTGVAQGKCFRYDFVNNTWTDDMASLADKTKEAGYAYHKEWGFVIAGGMTRYGGVTDKVMKLTRFRTTTTTVRVCKTLTLPPWSTKVQVLVFLEAQSLSFFKGVLGIVLEVCTQNMALPLANIGPTEAHKVASPKHG